VLVLENRRLSFLLSFLILVFAAATGAQTPPKPDKPALPEMWVKLTARVDLEKLKVGDAVPAVAAQSWVYQTCGVAAGYAVVGRVVSLSPWSDSSRTTEAAIAFAATCQDKSSIRLVLIALYNATDNGKSQMDLANSMPQGIGAGAYGRQSTNIEALPSPGAGDEIFPLAKFGEVKGIRHVSVNVAKGPQGATIVSTSDKKLRLDAGTRLALVPVPRSS
jgi:hypothetical protein